MYSSRFYHKELKTAILTALKDSLPKKVTEYPQDGQAQYGQRIGYNRAIQDIINIIDKKGQ